MYGTTQANAEKMFWLTRKGFYVNPFFILQFETYVRLKLWVDRFHSIVYNKEKEGHMMKELEKLLKENSGLLSRMKERDGNEKLNKVCEEIFKKDLTDSHKQSIIQIQRRKERIRKMTKAIYFDMDGTIANFYGVEGWLDDLINERTRPYAQARPLVNMNALARRLNNLQKKGFKIGIVSWLSKNGTENFNKAVTETKLAWLSKHLHSVNFDEIKIVPYGVPKSEVVENSNGILFDDEEPNRKNWKGQAFDESKIMEILKAVAQVVFYGMRRMYVSSFQLTSSSFHVNINYQMKKGNKYNADDRNQRNKKRRFQSSSSIHQFTVFGTNWSTRSAIGSWC